MTYDDALSYIKTVSNFGSKSGLNRIKKLMDLLGNPQDKLKFVHIAGTNGKGSTATMLANCLLNAGYKTGKFISPYVYSFGERISINNAEILPERLSFYVEKIKNALETSKWSEDFPTEFEIITAIGFMYFADEKCDIVCLEVGLGGRYDATNIIKSPILSVITKISLDHTKILGDTVSQIACEKCQIIKNSLCVSYCDQDSDVLEILKNYNAIFPNLDNLKVEKCDLSGSEILYNGKKYSISLIGEHQIYNALTVIEILNKLNSLGFCISDTDIFTGLSQTKFNARMEIISKNPLVIVDGSHNLDGISALCKTIEQNFNGQKILLIMGMLKDKDFAQSVENVSKFCKTAYFVNVDSPRFVDFSELMKYSKCSDDFGFSTLKEAVCAAKNCDFDAILVCGSLYLVKDIKKFF